jgi:hypothetical protein
MMIIALSTTIPTVESFAVEETAPMTKFMGVFKGGFRDSYPKAIVVKRFLINNGAFAVNSKIIGDAETIQKMTDKVINDFISKGSESCKSVQYFVIEEIATQLSYHPDGSHLLHSDANVVCFNMVK